MEKCLSLSSYKCNTDLLYLFICLAIILPDIAQSGKELLFMAINIVQLGYIKGM